MRRVPYPAPLDSIDPSGSLVLLVEQPAGRSRPAPVRRIRAGVTMQILAAVGLFIGGVAWGASRAGQPSVQSVSLVGGAAVIIGAATAGRTAALYPGGTADLLLPVANPNPFPVRISASVDGSDCRDPALSLTRPLVVPASLRLTTVAFPAAVQMGLRASNDCQGQVLSVNLTQVRAQR